MKKYKVTFERKRNGKKLDWSKDIFIETSRVPKVGEGQVLMCHPPIIETIFSVEEVPETKINSSTLDELIIKVSKAMAAKVVTNYDELDAILLLANEVKQLKARLDEHENPKN